MAMKANHQGRDSQPPIIRSPALENLGHVATPPERKSRVATAVAKEKPRPKGRASGPLVDTRDKPDPAEEERSEVRIEPLPPPSKRGDYALFGAVVGLLDRKSTRLNSSHIPLSRMP